LMMIEESNLAAATAGTIIAMDFVTTPRSPRYAHHFCGMSDAPDHWAVLLLIRWLGAAERRPPRGPEALQYHGHRVVSVGAHGRRGQGHGLRGSRWVMEASDQVPRPLKLSLGVPDSIVVCGCRILTCMQARRPPHWVLGEMAIWPRGR
jgi:hypothetical protein